MGGILLLLLMVVSTYLVSLIIQTDISRYSGMRSMNDPIMNLFCFCPFVIASAIQAVLDVTRNSLKGSQVQKGLMSREIS